MLEAMSRDLRIPLDVPFERLSPKQQRQILYGTGERWLEIEAPAAGGSQPLRFQYKGLYPAVEEASRVSYVYRQRLSDLVGEVPCSACGGSRLRDAAAAVRLNGTTIGQLCELPLSEALRFLKSIKLRGAEKRIAGAKKENQRGFMVRGTRSFETERA